MTPAALFMLPALMFASNAEMPTLSLATINRPLLASPRRNQRTERKNRRRRHAAGDRTTFSAR